MNVQGQIALGSEVTQTSGEVGEFNDSCCITTARHNMWFPEALNIATDCGWEYGRNNIRSKLKGQSSP
jgi:hypothetical protein